MMYMDLDHLKLLKIYQNEQLFPIPNFSQNYWKFTHITKTNTKWLETDPIASNGQKNYQITEQNWIYSKAVHMTE